MSGMGVTGAFRGTLMPATLDLPTDPLLGEHLPPNGRPVLDLSQFPAFEFVVVTEQAMTWALGSPVLTPPRRPGLQVPTLPLETVQ